MSHRMTDVLSKQREMPWILSMPRNRFGDLAFFLVKKAVYYTHLIIKPRLQRNHSFEIDYICRIKTSKIRLKLQIPKVIVPFDVKARLQGYVRQQALFMI